MRNLKERKLSVWNNNRMSSFLMMKKNYHHHHRRVNSLGRWKTEFGMMNHHHLEPLNRGKIDDREYDSGKMKMMVWNNNRLMSCSSAPILKRHRSNENVIDDDDDLIIGKERTTTTTTISDLPEELLAQVLVRLSLKDIRSCLCAQKAWLSLIKTRMFITLYSNHQISSSSINNNKYLFFWKNYPTAYELRVDDIQCEKYLTLKSPPDQPQFDNLFIRLVSNGLICIYNITHRTDHDIYLWNPVIQKYKTLPNSPHLPYIFERTLSKAIAFGFVPEINDYVVVYIVKYGLRGKPDTHSCVTCVYSLNTNSWRKITHHNVSPALGINDEDSFFVNGVAVWAGQNSQNNTIIICFDTKTDVLRQILLPEWVSRGTCDRTIHPLGESIVCFAKDEFYFNKVSMWVLKGDMMNEFLWEKKVTVKFRKFLPVYVLGLRNNGDPILCNSYDMISYNLDSYKSYDLVTSWDSWTPLTYWTDTMDLTPFNVVIPFVESLALLDID